MRMIGAILVFGLIGFIGLFGLYKTVPAIFMTQVSKFWNKEIATVESVEMIISEGGHSRKSHDAYEVYVSYTYTIGNKTYRGNNIGFGYRLNSIENNSEIFETLKYAKKISVYVNPFDEEDSVITTGLNNSTIGFFIFSIMWNSFIMMIIMTSDFKNEQRKENEIFI